MEDISTYISKSCSSIKLTPQQKQTLLELDREYGSLYKEFWYKWDRTDCKNMQEEFDKFISERKKGNKYYPQLQLVKDDLDESWLSKALTLKSKFSNFHSFISKYYIENINYMYNQVNMTLHKDDPYILLQYNSTMVLPVSDEDYEFAWELLKKHPYEDVRKDQPYRGEDILPLMQSHMDKRGYGFKIELNPYMVARQNVEPHNKTLHIKTNGRFNDLDVESLRIHEIDIHVARRYWGYKTGLNLFADGLLYRNTLDEGLAINQSLHHNKFGVKPNLEFEIAIKTVIGRHIMEKDFCELYDMLIDKLTTPQNKNIIEIIVFKNICRFKRTLCDCSKIGGDSHGETDYLCGYRMIHKMNKSQIKDLIQYNIGPGQIKDLPSIKKFLEVNVFNKF